MLIILNIRGEIQLFEVRSIIAAIEFANPQWVVPMSLIWGAATVVLIVGYRSSPGSLGLKALLVALKSIGFALLAICLLNPTLVQTRATPGENILALLVDNSASMQIGAQSSTTRFPATNRKNSNTQSRGEAVVELLKSDADQWMTRLSQDFDLRRYRFDERLTRFEELNDLTFDGSRSQLTTALTSLRSRFGGQPLAGILLMTDGVHAASEISLEEFDGIPVYPVLTSPGLENPFDIALDNVSVSESPFEDAPVTVSAQVTTTATATVKVLASIREVQSPLIAETESATAETPSDGMQQIVIVPSGQPAPLRFQIKPERLGISFYELTVTEYLAGDSAEGRPEMTLRNNSRLAVVDRANEKSRILYVAGRPNWEFKFLNRSLAEDLEVQLVGLLRIAKKEAKFDFRGRADENSNSLFRGQERDADEETESYDQAVLIRLNTRDAEELSDGFPKSKQALYQYDAIILDDIESDFFTPEQQTLIDRFVAERGGGLLMLGGRDSYEHGGWSKTPLRDALPVYQDEGLTPQSGSLRWDLTREGWLEPWMRVRPTEVEEENRLRNVPPLDVLSSVRGTKPGARVFADVQDSTGSRFPAVVGQYYGTGRAAAVLLGDLWKWSTRRELGQEDDLARSWRQMTRWLVANVPQRLEATYEWTMIGTVPAVKIFVRVRDAEFQPQENVVVNVSLQLPPDPNASVAKSNTSNTPSEGATQDVILLTAEPSLEEPGLFETVYVPRRSGSYLATVSLEQDSVEEPQQVAIGWTTQPDADEFQQVDVNIDALQSLAERTGGKVLQVADLSEFARSLPQREMPVTEIRTTPLWHSPWILLSALACLALEWGIRRTKGMP